MDFTWNTAGFDKAMDLIRNEYTGLSKEAVDEVAVRVKDRAVQLAPEVDGNLKRSGRVVKSKTRKTDLHVVKIRFGNKKAPYAAYVEFDPTDKHPTGQARFLTDAARTETRNIPQAIGAKIKSKSRGRK